MPLTLEARIEAYASLVEHALELEEPEEVSAMLVWRDSIAESLLQESNGHSDRNMAALRRADTLLRTKMPALYRRHPQVFDDNRDSVPDDYWWWKLGPGEEARAR